MRQVWWCDAGHVGSGQCCLMPPVSGACPLWCNNLAAACLSPLTLLLPLSPFGRYAPMPGPKIRVALANCDKAMAYLAENK